MITRATGAAAAALVCTVPPADVRADGPGLEVGLPAAAPCGSGPGVGHQPVLPAVRVPRYRFHSAQNCEGQQA